MNSTEHPVKVGLSDAFLALLPSQPPSQFTHSLRVLLQRGYLAAMPNCGFMSVLKMRSVTRSTSIIVFRLTPQRSLAALLSSSHFCPVSSTQSDLYGTALPHYWTLTPERRVSDSPSLSSTHNLRPLPDIQLDHRLRLVQHNSTVGWDFESRILQWNRSEPRSPHFVLAEFQVLWRYWPA